MCLRTASIRKKIKRHEVTSVLKSGDLLIVQKGGGEGGDGALSRHSAPGIWLLHNEFVLNEW